MILLEKNKSPIHIDDIWYSNEKRIKSIWNVFAMDDRGKLNIYENRIRFTGKKIKLNINNVENIFIIRPIPSYGAHSISGLFCIILIWYSFLIVYSSIEYFLAFFIMIIILYPVSLFLTRSDWIGIEYKDHGKINNVFFTDGSLPEGSVLKNKNSLKESDSLFKRFQFLNINENH